MAFVFLGYYERKIQTCLPSGRFQNPTAAYFVSFATVYWLDVFVREEYFGILTDSVDYCRK
jgi:hypothetical protein